MCYQISETDWLTLISRPLIFVEFFEGKTGDDVASGDDMDVESDELQDLQGEKSLLPPEAFLPIRTDRLIEEGSASPDGNVSVLK